MEKRKIDRYLEIFRQASNVNDRFSLNKVRVNCIVFVGTAWMEKILTLANLKALLIGFNEHDCKIWQDAFKNGDWLCYRSSDLYLTVYIDVNTIQY